MISVFCRIYTEYATRCWLSETHKTIWKMAQAKQQTEEEWRGYDRVWNVKKVMRALSLIVSMFHNMA